MQYFYRAVDVSHPPEEGEEGKQGRCLVLHPSLTHSLSDMGTRAQQAVTFRCLLPATSLPAPLPPVCHHNLPSINEPDSPLSAGWLRHCRCPWSCSVDSYNWESSHCDCNAAQRGFVYSSLDSSPPELSSHISAVSSTETSQLSEQGQVHLQMDAQPQLWQRCLHMSI